MQLSIVTTLYCSQPHLEEFFERIQAQAQAVTEDYEIIFVNDGSPDDSCELAVGFIERDPRVIVVDLSRNFGHHTAIMAGLEIAQGQRVFLIDCDLEEDPELLGQFTHIIDERCCDAVYGVQTKRKGGVVERISGALFYRLFNAISSHPVVPNLIMARLMTRRYVDTLLRYSERTVFLAGLFAHVGYEQVSVPVFKHSHSPSSYSMARKLTMAVEAMTSFSSKPLIWVFYLGVFLTVTAACEGLYLIIRHLFISPFGQPGWASLMVSVWFLGGVGIFCLGLIGMYIAKLFDEVKGRPRTTVRHIFCRESNAQFPQNDKQREIALQNYPK
ncbi:MAG: glycosyltransferase [Phycisphaera sp.]|nr:glycosyltransferase [Phycisphaera sp.]